MMHTLEGLSRLRMSPPENPVSVPAADTSAAAQFLQDAPGSVWGFAAMIIASLLVVTGTWYLSRGLVYVLNALAERSAKRRLLYKRLVPITRLTLWLIAFYVVGSVILGLGARELVAAATAIGVAVGFAAQDLLKNIFGGIVILFDQPFQVGDKIEVNDTYGEVVSIGLRSTRIVTLDDNLITVPNAQIVNGQVSNANAGDIDCQVVTNLYLPHASDADRAERLAFQAATNSEYVYLDKPVSVEVREALKEYPYLHLQVKAYVLDNRHERQLRTDVTKRARRAFRADGLLTPEKTGAAEVPR